MKFTLVLLIGLLYVVGPSSSARTFSRRNFRNQADDEGYAGGGAADLTADDGAPLEDDAAAADDAAADGDLDRTAEDDAAAGGSDGFSDSGDTSNVDIPDDATDPGLGDATNLPFKGKTNYAKKQRPNGYGQQDQQQQEIQQQKENMQQKIEGGGRGGAVDDGTSAVDELDEDGSDIPPPPAALARSFRSSFGGRSRIRTRSRRPQRRQGDDGTAAGLKTSQTQQQQTPQNGYDNGAPSAGALKKAARRNFGSQGVNKKLRRNGAAAQRRHLRGGATTRNLQRQPSRQVSRRQLRRGRPSRRQQDGGDVAQAGGSTKGYKRNQAPQQQQDEDDFGQQSQQQSRPANSSPYRRR